MRREHFSRRDFVVPRDYAAVIVRRHGAEVIGVDQRTFKTTLFGAPAALVVERLFESPGRYTLGQLIAEAPATTGARCGPEEILSELKKSGLFNAASASFRWPGVSLILSYALKNLLCRMKLFVTGRDAFVAKSGAVAVVDRRRRRRVGGVEPYGLSYHLAAARLACALPGVSLDSLVTAAAMAWNLRRSGYPAEIIKGRQVGHVEAYHWVEVDGIVVDVGDSELDLEPFLTHSAHGWGGDSSEIS